MRIATAAMAALSIAALSMAGCSKPATAPSDSTAAADASATPPAPVTPPAATPEQGPAATTAGGGNDAVKDPHDQPASAAKPGANSFTQSQAKSHIENAGYSNVEITSQDASGVWHATGMKGGKTYTLGLDFKGNIVAQ